MFQNLASIHTKKGHRNWISENSQGILQNNINFAYLLKI